MLDPSTLNEITEILENLEDEQLAASLLSELNEKSTQFGKLVLNTDPSLGHDEWKIKCDQAKEEIEHLVEKIRNL